MPHPNPHRLICLSGSGPGAGKSTAAEWLHDLLEGHQINRHWIYEDHVLYLNEFSAFVEDIHTDPPRAAASLLKAVHQFVANRQDDDVVYISDSIFPCVMWLYGAGYQDSHVVDLCDEIMHLLNPLQPIVFYLKVDVQQALDRALIHRGEQYIINHLPDMNKWPRLRDNPIHDKQDMIDLFSSADALSMKVLDRWQDVSCIIDSSGSFKNVQSIIMDRLKLEKIDRPIVHPKNVDFIFTPLIRLPP